ncbi:EcsC family protein [Microbacterium testaceum]|uniref:EcsC family protein n=1 Tax=Microbacterium testaceum TaxID=2033 RepID=UPI001651EDB7|nr:EcsC family protein [Microbacterium testaceum]
MPKPSPYEQDAWSILQKHQGKPLSHALNDMSDKLATGATAVGRKAEEFLDSHPRANSAVARGRVVAAKGAAAVSGTARHVAGIVPGGVEDWTGAAAGSVKRAAARASRVGLSPKRVVELHRKKGHAVDRLPDVRRLDLEQVDRVGRRGAHILYPSIAALAGAGSGVVISGVQFGAAATAGAAAAPSAGVVLGAFTTDAAVVLTLSTRAVGHIALLYGYDPEDPSEKLFALSVVNAATAMSASAKTAAMADVSRLTQALIRGKTWEILNQSVVSKVSVQFSKAFGVRLTKKGLGKVVPVVGILVGGTFNWATLEGIFDAASTAYRRRFLLEKYPQLQADTMFDLQPNDHDASEESDQEISVVDELARAGGPDLREKVSD